VHRRRHGHRHVRRPRLIPSLTPPDGRRGGPGCLSPGARGVQLPQRTAGRPAWAVRCGVGGPVAVRGMISQGFLRALGSFGFLQRSHSRAAQVRGRRIPHWRFPGRAQDALGFVCDCRRRGFPEVFCGLWVPLGFRALAVAPCGADSETPRRARLREEHGNFRVGYKADGEATSRTWRRRNRRLQSSRL
jgi:hypothetical protein